MSTTTTTTTEKTPKLTQKLFFQNVLALLHGSDTEFTSEELAEFAEARIAKIDETNAKNREADRKPTAKELATQEENARLREALVGIVREATEPLVRDAIAEALGVSPQKVSVLAKNAIASGEIAKAETKVDGKKRVAYVAGDVVSE